MKFEKYYTGIGSRRTPDPILNKFRYISKFLDSNGWCLRSGGASGADSAFEENSNIKEIYIPWKGFNNNTSDLFEISDEAFVLAKEIHPAWERLSSGGQKLHARNIHQVLGKDLTSPSDMVICWTDGGKDIGGTRTAIICARQNNIPIFNFGRDCIEEFRNFLK